jgi:hypothetical protein
LAAVSNASRSVGSSASKAALQSCALMRQSSGVSSVWLSNFAVYSASATSPRARTSARTESTTCVTPASLSRRSPTIFSNASAKPGSLE